MRELEKGRKKILDADLSLHGELALHSATGGNQQPPESPMPDALYRLDSDDPKKPNGRGREKYRKPLASLKPDPILEEHDKLSKQSKKAQKKARKDARRQELQLDKELSYVSTKPVNKLAILAGKMDDPADSIEDLAAPMMMAKS